MTKLTIIGAGSTVFTKNIVIDLLTIEQFKSIEIALMDIDQNRLIKTKEVLEIIAKKMGATPKISMHTNRRESLLDADFVQTTIQVGGYKPSTVIDFDIPKKYGLQQTIGDTLGIGGIFDVASYYGLNKRDKEDYGQTLGTWGVGEGCYIVQPVLGPTTARDTVASIANFSGGDAWYNVTVRNDTHYVSDFDNYFSRGATGVDFLAKNLGSLENLEENSIDFYASVKSLYLQERRKQIANADEITETLDDSDWEELETQ